MGGPVTRGNKAFISYSQMESSRLAGALQGALERLGKRWYQRRNFRVFLDKENLAAGSGLSQLILRQLESSEYLILMASPASIRRPWVREELAFWFSRPAAESRFLIALVGGTVGGTMGGELDWNLTSALPPDLLVGTLREVPLYVDFTWVSDASDLSLDHPRFREGVRALAAALHGCSPYDLDSRDRTEHLRARRVLRSIWILAGLTLLVGLLALQRQTVARSRELASVAEAQLAADPALAVQIARKADRLARWTGQRMPGVMMKAIFESHQRGAAIIGNQGFRKMEVSSDGRWLVAASSSGAIWTWKVVPDGEELKFTPALPASRHHTNEISKIRFDPMGDLVVTADNKGRLAAWRLGANAPCLLFEASSTQVDSLDFENSGRTVRIRRKDGKEEQWFIGACMGLAPDNGRTNASHLGVGTGFQGVVRQGSENTTTELFRTNGSVSSSGRPVLVLRGHRTQINDHAWVGTNRWLVTASGLLVGGREDDDNSIRVWRVRLPREQRLEVKVDSSWNVGLGANAGFRLLVRDPQGAVWETGEKEAVMRRVALSEAAESVTLSGDGRIGAAALYSGAIEAFDVATRKTLGISKKGTQSPTHLRLSEDGALAVSVEETGDARLWKTEGAVDLGVVPLSGGGRLAYLNHDASLLLTVDAANYVRLWRLRDGRAEAHWFRELRLPAVVNDAAFSPAGSIAALALANGSTSLWNFSRDRMLSGVRGHGESVVSVAFSRDGRFLATASTDSIARVMRVEDGYEFATFAGNGEPMLAVAFTAAGTRIVTVSQPGVLMEHDCEECGGVTELRELAKARARSRPMTKAEQRLYLGE